MKISKVGFFLVICIFAFALSYGCGQTGSSDTTTTTTLAKTWTVMLFCAGDNDLESHIFDNVVELQAAGSSAQVNMVAQADWMHCSGTSETFVGSTEIQRGVGRWYIKKGSETRLISTLVATLEECNTGTAEAIRDFVVWTKNNYPASNYLLIVSSHGDGWKSKDVKKRGFGQDFTDMTPSDIMNLVNFKKVLPEIKAALGKNLDILGIDCCLNGMVDVAYQIKDYVTLLVASEDTVPGYGFPYTTFGQYIVANPTATAEAFAKTIVEQFNTKYITTYPNNASTLAVIDLSKISALASAVRSFVEKINTTEASVSVEAYTAIRDLLNRQSGGMPVVQAYNQRDDYRDLWYLADQIIYKLTSEAYTTVEAQAAITIECAAIKTAVENAVLLSKWSSKIGGQNNSNSHGISIYAPTQQTNYTSYTLEAAAQYSTIDFAASAAGDWKSFLDNLNQY